MHKMWYFIILLWLLRVRGDAEVTVSTANTKLETTVGKTLIEENNIKSKQTVPPYPPHTWYLKDEVTSGPIVLVNKKTLFIPDLRYSGGHQNVHFWVSNGTNLTSDGLIVPDENGSSESLHCYQGENIYINLPDGVTTDNVECFGVYSIDETLDLGHVPLKVSEEVPEVNSSRNDNKFIMRLAKCCPAYSFVTTEGCGNNSSIVFEPDFRVLEHNKTHFNNASLDLNMIVFEPYIFSPECNIGKYFLVGNNEDNKIEDEFAILKNGSLLVKGSISGILSQTKFCVDNVQDEESVKIFVCIPEPTQNVQKAMFVAYVTLTLVSTFCFAGTFFLYFFWLKIEKIHRKCFTAYVLAMSITFLSLTIIQIGHVEGSGCEFLGFLLQFSMIASFTLLAILCVDILVIVRYIDEDMKKRKRKAWYLGTALSVPTLFLIISLARNLTPDVPNSFFKPQYGQNYCNFDEKNQRTPLFYIPISVALVVGIICLIATKLKIAEYDRINLEHYFWITNGKTYKFMFRQCLLTLVIMTISWITNMIMNFLDESSGILNAAIIFEALQGVLIVAVFTANHYGSSYVERRRIRENNPETLVHLNHLNEQNPCTD